MLKVLPFEHTGNKKAKTLVVLLHGFPDTMKVWDDLLKDSNNADAQYLAITYPNFHKAETMRFGQDLSIIADRIKQTVDFIDQGRNLKKIFVTHDIGAIFGYLVDEQYPNYMDDMIALDYGGRHGDITKIQSITLMFYYLFLAFMFIVSLIPLFGNRISTLLSRTVIQTYTQQKVPSTYNASMNYIFLYYKMNKLNAKFRNHPTLGYLHDYEPSVPVVYIYGTKKPFQFHNVQWFELLAKNRCSENIGVEGGHWIMKDNLGLLVKKLDERIQRQKIELK